MIDESARIIVSLFYSLLLGNLNENVTSESWHKFVLDVILYKLAHIYDDVQIQLINLQPKRQTRNTCCMKYQDTTATLICIIYFTILQELTKSIDLSCLQHMLDNIPPHLPKPVKPAPPPPQKYMN